MLKNKWVMLGLVLILILTAFHCKTLNKTVKESDDFDILFNEALNNTNRGKYKLSIDLLNNLLTEFPKKEELAIIYNIGYNYYKLKNFDEANRYFDRLIDKFENSNNQKEWIAENRKFIILAENIKEKIKMQPEEQKDPYRIKEDIEEFKKKRPKRPNK